MTILVHELYDTTRLSVFFEKHTENIVTHIRLGCSIFADKNIVT